MASRNVVREDVVQISFDVDYDELTQARRETDEFVNSLKGDMQDAVRNTKSSVGRIGDEFSDLRDDMRQTDRQTDSLKSTLASWKTSAIDKIGNKFTEAKQKIADMKKQAEETDGVFGKLAGSAGKIAGAFSAALGVGAVVSNANDKTAATNTMQAQTGASGKELKDMKKAMSEIYTSGMGEDWNSVATAIAEVKNQLGASKGELQDLATDAILLQDTFGYDVKESVRAADMMMKQFGISGDDAYNLIVQGAQNGLDKNGNLLDTMNEYSVHFKQMGFGAEDMMNMFSNAADQGVFDVDKIGDAVKEFGIRAVDGSETTAQGFAMIGLEADEMAEKFKKGGKEGRDAFYETIQALNDMEDPVKREQAGVALFGTMWEDMGSKAVLALGDTKKNIDLTKNALEDVKNVKYDDALSALKELGRTVNDALAGPVGNAVNKAMTYIRQFTAGLRGEEGAQETSFGRLGAFIADVGGTIKSVFGEIMKVASPIFSFLTQHIDTIGKAFMIMGTLILAAKAPLIALTLAMKAWTLITTLAKGAQLLFNGVMLVWKGICLAVQGVQWLLNSALLACPITWIVIGIGLLIAAGIALWKNWETVKNFIIGLWNTIKTKASEIWNGIKSAITGAIDSAVQWVKDKFNSVVDFLGGLKDTFFQKGADIINGLWNGIKSVFGKIGDIGSAIKDKLLGGLSWFKFGSPSKRMAMYGKWTIEGFTGGAEKETAQVEKTVKGVIENPFKDTVSQTVVKGENDYVPQTSAPSYTKTSSSEKNVYNPQFTLNMNGSSDRDTERKVRQWVKDGIQDAIDGMNRRNPRLTEV